MATRVCVMSAFLIVIYLQEFNHVEGKEHCDTKYWCEKGHCCGQNHCCTYYYELWWFWVIWLFIALIVGCCFCHQKRLRNHHFFWMSQAERSGNEPNSRTRSRSSRTRSSSRRSRPRASSHQQRAAGQTPQFNPPIFDPEKLLRLPTYDEIRDMPRDPPPYDIITSQMTLMETSITTQAASNDEGAIPQPHLVDILEIDDSPHASLLDNEVTSQAPVTNTVPLPTEAPPPYIPGPAHQDERQ